MTSSLTSPFFNLCPKLSPEIAPDPFPKSGELIAGFSPPHPPYKPRPRRLFFPPLFPFVLCRQAVPISRRSSHYRRRSSRFPDEVSSNRARERPHSLPRALAQLPNPTPFSPTQRIKGECSTEVAGAVASPPVPPRHPGTNRKTSSPQSSFPWLTASGASLRASGETSHRRGRPRPSRRRRPLYLQRGARRHGEVLDPEPSGLNSRVRI